MTIITHEEYNKHIFKLSKKNKGWIYVMKSKSKEHFTYDKITNKSIPCDVWKFGKTKDLQKRISYYGAKYELLISWKVDHLTLREWAINEAHEIEEHRHERHIEYNDEHMLFDCTDTVEFFATCEIKTENDSILFETLTHDKQSIQSREISGRGLLLDLIRIK
jgi:hypothetical protein